MSGIHNINCNTTCCPKSQLVHTRGMDPISQAALGAAVAQTTAHHKLGFKVVLAGAVAGAMPDIDVFFSIGQDYFTQLQLHRGLTHSLFFALVAGPAIGYLLWKNEGRTQPIKNDGQSERLKYWILAMTMAVLSHPLLDVLTPYGTQLLAPFSEQRFAIMAMPIIDPLYTLSLLGGLTVAWIYRSKDWVQHIGIVTMIVSCAYLVSGIYLGHAATREAQRQLADQGIVDVEVQSFPTILQLHYRRVVARTATEDRVGYISMWQPCPIEWGVAPREPEPRFKELSGNRKVDIFEWFTMGWIHKTTRLVNGQTQYRMYDLRYGTTTQAAESLFAIKALPTGEQFKVSMAGTSRDPGVLFNNLVAQAYPDSCPAPV